MNRLGFTIVEITIVLGLTAALALFVSVSFRNNIRIEAFTATVRDAGEFVENSHTRSYTVETDPTLPATSRGTYLDINIDAETINESLLYGAQISRTDSLFSGITGDKDTGREFLFDDTNAELLEIEFTQSGVTTRYTSGSWQIANLAPLGQGFLLRSQSNPATASPGNFRSGEIKLVICEKRDGASSLAGTVTFNTVSGIIQAGLDGDYIPRCNP